MIKIEPISIAQIKFCNANPKLGRIKFFEIDNAKSYQTIQSWYWQPQEQSNWLAIELKFIKTYQALLLTEQSISNGLLGLMPEDLPDLEDDVYYAYALLNKSVICKSKNLGVVKQIIETKAHYILVCKDLNGIETLIPFTNQDIINVDNTIEVNLPS